MNSLDIVFPFNTYFFLLKKGGFTMLLSTCFLFLIVFTIYIVAIQAFKLDENELVYDPLVEKMVFKPSTKDYILLKYGLRV